MLNDDVLQLSGAHSSPYTAQSFISVIIALLSHLLTHSELGMRVYRALPKFIFLLAGNLSRLSLKPIESSSLSYPA
jgi:hypothetical protein